MPLFPENEHHTSRITRNIDPTMKPPQSQPNAFLMAGLLSAYGFSEAIKSESKEELARTLARIFAASDRGLIWEYPDRNLKTKRLTGDIIGQALQAVREHGYYRSLNLRVSIRNLERRFGARATPAMVREIALGLPAGYFETPGRNEEDYAIQSLLFLLDDPRPSYEAPFLERLTERLSNTGEPLQLARAPDPLSDRFVNLVERVIEARPLGLTIVAGSALTDSEFVVEDLVSHVLGQRPNIGGFTPDFPERLARAGPPLAFIGSEVADEPPELVASRFEFAAPEPPRAGLPGFSLDESAEPGPPPPRYTDIRILDGHFYSSDDVDDQSVLPYETPMLIGGDYTLEVALRARRIGLNNWGKSPARDPRRGEETVEIYVVVQARNEVIVFEESLATLEWPNASDSTAAFFRFSIPKSKADSAEESVHVTLFDRNLDFVDAAEVALTAHRPGKPGPHGGLRHVVGGLPGAMQLGDDGPRALSISITRTERGFVPTFLFRRGEGEAVEIGSGNPIRPGELAGLLAQLRDAWYDMIVGPYAHQLSPTKATYRRSIAALADCGTKAWRLLFDNAQGPMRGTSEALGDLLRGDLIASGATIQISDASEGNELVFPWGILIPPSAAEAAEIDPEQFWGARYQIEQVWNGPRKDGLEQEPVDVTFALDAGFGDAAEQERLLASIRGGSNGRISISGPIGSAKELFAELFSCPPSHLYYFFCHGYAPTLATEPAVSGIKSLQQRIERLKPDSPERNIWQTWLAHAPRTGDEAWMFLGESQITESDLENRRFAFNQRRPIIFMNMCQSAAIVPDRRDGFVRLFKRRNAAAVVGTEAPMTSLFADAFSGIVLEHLFKGEAIGTSLRRARVHFLERRNPLGLAYTLYGRESARLGNPTESQASGE
jgi:hypothetical protein